MRRADRRRCGASSSERPRPARREAPAFDGNDFIVQAARHVLVRRADRKSRSTGCVEERADLHGLGAGRINVAGINEGNVERTRRRASPTASIDRPDQLETA